MLQFLVILALVFVGYATFAAWRDKEWFAFAVGVIILMIAGGNLALLLLKEMS